MNDKPSFYFIWILTNILRGCVMAKWLTGQSSPSRPWFKYSVFHIKWHTPKNAVFGRHIKNSLIRSCYNECYMLISYTYINPGIKVPTATSEFMRYHEARYKESLVDHNVKLHNLGGHCLQYEYVFESKTQQIHWTKTDAIQPLGHCSTLQSIC